MKMETPKMDVVRFQEADVIVASGFATRFATVAKAGGAAGDLEITFGEHFYNYTSLEEQKEDKLLSGYIRFDLQGNAGSKTLNDLLADDEKNGAYDGYYQSVDDGNSYQYLHQ